MPLVGALEKALELAKSMSCSGETAVTVAWRWVWGTCAAVSPGGRSGDVSGARGQLECLFTLVSAILLVALALAATVSQAGEAHLHGLYAERQHLDGGCAGRVITPHSFALQVSQQCASSSTV